MVEPTGLVLKIRLTKQTLEYIHCNSLLKNDDNKVNKLYIRLLQKHAYPPKNNSLAVMISLVLKLFV